MRLFVSAAISGALLAAVYAVPVAAQQPVEQGPKNAPQFEPAFEGQTRAPAANSGISLSVEEVAGGLEHPWGIVAIPNGEGYLVTERPGRLRHVGTDGTISEPVDGLPEVAARDQGGLLDIALAEDFAESRRIYWTYAKPTENGRYATAAARAVLSEDYTQVTEVEEIFQQHPPSPTANHFGSRIVPDGEGLLFITTGEHFSTEERIYAQDLDKTYGKVVRVADDGSVPQDNPFVGEEGAAGSIWSLGHRNIQAAALRPGTGTLWVVEHGPKGGDEINLVQPGENYGWPEVAYGVNYDGSSVGTGKADHASAGFVEPRYYWDPVIAPSGMIFYEGDMFADWQGDVLVGSLYPGALVRLEMDGERIVGEERFLEDAGRIRDVAIDRDGAVLVVTDESNGRILRLTPEDDG